MSSPNEVPVELDLGVQWDVGAPLPILISSDYRTYLAFILASVDPIWEGAYVNSRTGQEGEDIGIVSFKGCWAMQFGAPNEEAFHGHRLWSQGLRPYAPFEVVHSQWIEQLKQANSVHPYNHKVLWEKKRHFIFGFHDSMFECVAEALSVEVVHGSMAEVACMLAKRVWQ